MPKCKIMLCRVTGTLRSGRKEVLGVEKDNQNTHGEKAIPGRHNGFSK